MTLRSLATECGVAAVEARRRAAALLRNDCPRMAWGELEEAAQAWEQRRVLQRAIRDLRARR